MREARDAALARQEEMAHRIQGLEQVIDKLKAVKDKSEALPIFLEEGDEREQFEKRVDEASCAISRLPRIAGEALFYWYCNGEFRPRDEDWDDVKRAIEEKYLEEATDEGTVRVVTDDPKIRQCLEAIRELSSFLDEVSAPFTEDFERRHEFAPEMDSRRFWESQLL